MKKKSFLFISLLIASVLFTGCSNMLKYTSFVYICDSEHGYIEVELVLEHKQGSEFLLTAHPEDGYCLEKKNLFIYTDLLTDLYNGSKEFTIPYFPGNDYAGYFRLSPSKTKKENQYTFRAEKNSNVTISAIFTKK